MAKILLVEDHDLNRKILTKLLSKMGFTIVEAESGEQSVHLATSQSIDVILMDMNLPGINGAEAIAKIKSVEQSRLIPVIGLSAYDCGPLIEQAKQFGCDDFDTKPINLERLVKKISRYLSQEALPIGAQPFIARADEGFSI